MIFQTTSVPPSPNLKIKWTIHRNSQCSSFQHTRICHLQCFDTIGHGPASWKHAAKLTKGTRKYLWTWALLPGSMSFKFPSPSKELRAESAPTERAPMTTGPRSAAFRLETVSERRSLFSSYSKSDRVYLSCEEVQCYLATLAPPHVGELGLPSQGMVRARNRLGVIERLVS